MVLLLKPGKSQQSPSAYRLISLLDEGRILLERVLARELTTHLSTVGLDQDDRQFGFRQGRLTIEPLLRLMSLSERVLRWGGVMLAVGLAISSAFSGLSWTDIRSALVWHRVPDYLAAMIPGYLSAGILNIPGGTAVSAGVGGLYCGVLPGVSVTCYGDDTLVAEDRINYEQMALRGEEGVVADVWLIERLGFRVSLSAGGKISMGGKAAQIGGRMKYLVFVLDGRRIFEDHFEELASACR